MRRIGVALVALVAVLVLAGCSSSAVSTTKEKLCQPVTTINSSLASLANIGENTTVGEIKPVTQKVATAINTLDKIVPDNAGVTLDNIKAANDNLIAATQGLPDDATLAQSSVKIQDFKAQVAKAQTATTNLASTLQCST